MEPGDLQQRHAAAGWVLRTGGQAVPRAAAPPPHGDHAQEDEASGNLQPGNYAVVDSIKKLKLKKKEKMDEKLSLIVVLKIKA